MWSQILLENNPEAQCLCLLECSPNYSCPRVQGVCYPAQREQTRVTALTRLQWSFIWWAPGLGALGALYPCGFLEFYC